MNLSKEGIRFIHRFEKCRLRAYKDGDHWSIGWGHNGPDVAPDMVITKARADELFAEDIAWAERAVGKVTVPLLQNEFDALVSFVYNIGEPRFLTSTLLKKLNNGDRAGAANQFPRWNRFEGKVNQGLVSRRAAERSLFLGFNV